MIINLEQIFYLFCLYLLKFCWLWLKRILIEKRSILRDFLKKSENKFKLFEFPYEYLENNEVMLFYRRKEEKKDPVKIASFRMSKEAYKSSFDYYEKYHFYAVLEIIYTLVLWYFGSLYKKLGTRLFRIINESY
jgi:hypothetical protein